MTKLMRDKIILALYSVFGEVKLFHKAVLILYKNIFFPLLRTYIKYKHPEILDLQYRNSITTPKFFNAFLSDLDISIVIDDTCDPSDLIKTFLKLKSIFIILDCPEIYTLKEIKHINKLQEENSWGLVEFALNFRKIHWCQQSLNSDDSPLNKIKQSKSIKKSYSRILANPYENDKNIYSIEDFKILKSFIPTDQSEFNICYWSKFLETDNNRHLQLLLTTLQFPYLNSLMPGELLQPEIKNKISMQFVENKTALEYYELYLSKSSLRLAAAQGKKTEEYNKWINFLEAKLRSIDY